MGDSITEGTIVDLPLAPGDFVNVDDVVVVLETDKVSVDVRSPTSGALVEVLGEVDDVVDVGSPLFRIDTDADAPDSPGPPAPDEVASEIEEATASSPPAAQPAGEASAAPPPPPQPAAAQAPAPPPPPPPPSGKGGPPAPEAMPLFLGQRTERRAKMSRMRQRVAQRLKGAQNTAAMLTTFQECDMSKLMEMRNRYKDAFLARHGVKLGFMSAFVKASTAALQELPIVNAYIDGDEIVHREYVDVSVAVASPTGLVVPVLRNTETMSFADVERNIAVYGQKAKDGALSLDDMAGGTFTISNGGVFGSLMGTPIINPPQSAILGMVRTLR